jgi:hypothetical protein
MIIRAFIATALVIPLSACGGGGDTESSFCYPPIASLSCSETAPPPTEPAAVAAHVRDAAFPLRCATEEAAEEGGETWDLSVFHQLAEGQRLFMFGEVPGTNELGQMSAMLFESLARAGLVNVVAMELPLDLEAALRRYVETGTDPLADQVFPFYSANFFGRLLTESVRRLHAEGHEVVLAAVDSPFGTDLPIDRIRPIGERLQAHRGLVLDSLPEPRTMLDPFPPEYIASVIAYHDAIVDNAGGICEELTPDDCSTLITMARALWVAAAVRDESTDPNLWLKMREDVIYFNLRQHFDDDDARVYLHMGAFHTSKYEGSAGSQMARVHEPTRGRVVSVGPAFGAGSRVQDREGDIEISAAPAIVAEALAGADADPIFVSTHLPDTDCAGNPLAEEIDGFAGGPMAESFDGYLHIRLLTPASRPQDSTLPGARAREGFRDLHDRVRSLAQSRWAPRRIRSQSSE